MKVRKNAEIVFVLYVGNYKTYGAESVGFELLRGSVCYISELCCRIGYSFVSFLADVSQISQSAGRCCGGHVGKACHVFNRYHFLPYDS